MKILKVVLFTTVALLIVLSEASQAIAKGGGGGGSRCPETVPYRYSAEELAQIKKNTCISVSKYGRSETMLDWAENRVMGSMSDYEGSGFVIPFIPVKNPNLLPKELREFMEATKTQLISECQDAQFFWRASDSRVALAGFPFGNQKSLDEKNAYRLRVKTSCGKCQLLDKDLSEYSPMPTLSAIWHENPFTMFLFFCFMGIGLVFGASKAIKTLE